MTARKTRDERRFALTEDRKILSGKRWVTDARGRVGLCHGRIMGQTICLVQYGSHGPFVYWARRDLSLSRPAEIKAQGMDEINIGARE